MRQPFLPSFLFIALVCALSFVSCQKHEYDTSREPVAQVGQHFLYEDEIPRYSEGNLKNLPVNDGRSAAEITQDSLDQRLKFIQNWATQTLLYKEARMQVSNLEEIDQQVADYRHMLTINAYQNWMVQQRMQSPTEEEIATFYEEIKPVLILKEPILKGLMISFPLEAINLKEVRKTIKDIDFEDMAHVETLALNYAVKYVYTPNTWVSLESINKQMPGSLYFPAKDLKKGMLEISDSAYVSFAFISDFLNKDEIQPLSYATAHLNQILINKKKIEFLNQLGHDVYQKGLKDKDIYFFKKDSLLLEPKQNE